jgi:PAS domain S-box-containing protein
VTRLIRFFLIASVLVIAAITVVVFLHRQSEIRRLISFVEKQNVVLAQSFANTIWHQIADYVHSASSLTGDGLRERPETREIRDTVTKATAGLPVLKVKIYDLDGLTVFSSAAEDIGENKGNNPGHFLAATQGKPASKLAYEDTFSSFEGTVQDRDVVESYLPIRTDGGTVEGVFELYTDVTDLMAEIRRDTADLILGFSLVCGSLFVILFLIVRRADRTIGQQYNDISEKNTELEHQVSERKKAQEALRRTIENAPVGIVTTDLDHRITGANSAFCDMLGRAEQELIDRALDDYIHPHDVPMARSAMAAASKSGRTGEPIKQRYTRADGEVVFTEFHIAQAQDGNGEPVQYIAQVVDLTEQLKIEQEMKLQRQKLAHVSRVSTLGEMAAGIAHEINQPLAAISAFASGCQLMLKTGKSDEQSLSYGLEQIAEQTDRAGEVIRRLRELVKQGDQHREFVDINGLVVEALKLATTDTRTLNIEMKLELAKNLPGIEVDKIQIQQVLLNLVRNAIDAVEALGHDRMAITIFTSLNDDCEVVVSVADRGDGIPQDVAPVLFTPFFTTKESGMGMGLSICNSIVAAHGGRLWYTPNPDRGSTFHFSLPIAIEMVA